MDKKILNKKELNEIFEKIRNSKFIYDYKFDFENQKLYLQNIPELTEIEDWSFFEKEVLRLFGTSPIPDDTSYDADLWYLEFKDLKL